MAVYVRCPNCKNEYNIKHQKCPKCGTPKPRKGSFRIRIVHKGKTIRKLITGITQALAKEIDAKIKQEIIEGMYFEKKTDINFSDFVEQHYFPAEKHNKKESSLAREEQLYRKYIAPFLNDKTLSTIETKDIEKIKIHMIEKGLSARTIQYAIHTVRHIFNVAAQQGFFSGKNPTKNIKMQKKDNRRIRFLTPVEANKLLSELKKHSQDTYEIAFLSLHTGMRFGEIANLTWQDIDFERGLIYIKDPKSKENRVAYMTDEVKSILTERKKHSTANLVFPSRTGGVREKPPRTFERVVKKLGLNDGITDPRDKVVFHTLRHTFASWLVMNGTPLYTVKELLGHKTLAMTERYSHLAPDSKRKAVEKVFENKKSGQ